MTQGQDADERIAAIYALSQYARTAALSSECMVASSGSTPPLVPIRHLFVGRDGGDINDAHLHMRLWFAFMFVVAEGWQALGLEDPDVREALASLDLAGDLTVLRRFRNAVFHLQEDPRTAKFTALFARLDAGLMSRLLAFDIAVHRFFANWRHSTDLTALAALPVELFQDAT